MSKYVGKIVTNQAPAGYSVFFDGTGDYLTLANNAALQFGTGDFTFEAWVYPTNLQASKAAGEKTVIDTGTSGFYVSLWTGAVHLATWGVADLLTSSSTAVVNNTWFHVALTRSGTTVRCFVNGAIAGTATLSTNFSSSGSTFIGSSNVPSLQLQGYISNLRVIKGTALYTAAFTPPTQLLNITGTSLLTCNSPAIVDQSSNAFAITVNGNSAVSTFTPFTAYVPYNPSLGASTPGVWTLDEAMQAAATRQWNMYDPNFQNTTLLLHGNGTNGAQNNTFLDSSSNNFTITRNGNTTQGSFSPFSQTGWSNFFTAASSQNISTVSAASTAPGTGSFCAELWYYTTSTANQALFGNLESNTDTQWAIVFASGNTIRIQGWFTIFVSGNSGPINQWNHVAVCRSGTTMSIFVNGVRVGTATVSNDFSSTSNIRVGGPNGVDYFNGYISNARFVKGSSVYDPTQASITVPTAPLTAITNTQFLTCQNNRFVDNSTNNFTLTLSGTPSVQAFSPFYPTAAYTPATIGGSGYFDGTGDYLSFTGNSTTVGSGDFTIELWYYPTVFQNYDTLFGNTRGANGFNIGTNVNASVVWYSSSALQIDAGKLQEFAWNHIAFTRTSNTLRLYLNGSRIGATPTVSTNFSATGFVVGDTAGALGEACNGYISGVRVTNQSLASGSTFAVPTAPYTSNVNTNLLLNFTNAGIVDSTAKNVLETVGNAQISTTQSKFGGSSISFDGTGDRLITPASPNLDLSSGDFTVEGWFYSNTIAAGGASACARALAGNITSGSDIQWNIYRSGSSLIVRPYQGTTDYSINLGTIAANTWYHVALTRAGNTFRGFLNGVQAGATFTISGSLNNNTVWFGVIAGFLTVGGVDEAWNGYIDDLRITKGVARYTANFTPQTSQWQDQ